MSDDTARAAVVRAAAGRWDARATALDLPVPGALAASPGRDAGAPVCVSGGGCGANDDEAGPHRGEGVCGAR